ncbi:MAG TPA: transglycosylase SLT domain-containing protein [Thermomicrobiales bacterium]|jgi:hypothetical protein
MTPRRFLRGLLAVVAAALLVGHGTPVLADESSLRERHPNEVTPTPAPEGERGDGTERSPDGAVPAADAPAPSSADAAVDDSQQGTETPDNTEGAAPADGSGATIVPVQDAAAAAESEASVARPKPTPRTFDNPAAKAGGREPKAPKEPEIPTIPRLDDPVLRWLPEIMASAKANDVPPELIAGVMRLESDGNPNIISPDGARGLMQIMPDQLLGQGIGEEYWHDPATNIMAGGYELRERSWSYGTWEDAVGSYFGFGCDVFGTCTDVYVKVVFGWAAYYAPIIASPLSFGFAVLPVDWVPPPIAPFVEAAPVPVEEAPPPPDPPDKTPTPTVSATATPTAPPAGAGSPTPEPTGAPTDEPTPEPTAVPTDVPTDEPTEMPTDEPTAEPTAVPTDEPTEEPTEEPTDEPSDTPTDETGTGEGG